MAVTIEQLYQRLIAEGYPVPADVTKFRQQVWTMTRAGQIEAPERRPYTDGRRGKTGFYPDDTYDKIVQVITARHHVSKPTSNSMGAEPQQVRKLELSIQLPVALAAKVEGQILRGRPLGELLLKGMEWLVTAKADVKKALFQAFIQDFDLPAKEAANPKKLFQGRWGYVAALTMASLGYERAESLATELGVSPDEIVGDWVFTFWVKDGKVEVSATTKDGHKAQKAVQTPRGNKA